MSNNLASDLSAIVGAKHVYTQPKALKTFSADAYTFSPILTEELKDKRADIIVSPGNKDELYTIVAYAMQHGIPITMRGAGTGNYGQSVPLEGGIVILTGKLNKILNIHRETYSMTVQPGVPMGAMEIMGRGYGMELHCYPSTFMSATIGGFVGGGSGGIGSIRHGVLRDGMVQKAEILTATKKPDYVRLQGDELDAIIHAYGTTGIITELEIAMAPAMNWEESVITFPDLERAIRFSYALSLIGSRRWDKRLITICEWPIPSFFTPLQSEAAITTGRTAVLLELGEGQTDEVANLAQYFYGGTLAWRRSASRYRKPWPLSNCSWNHVTLWARKADSSFTYLQVQFLPGLDCNIRQTQALKAQFPNEVFWHLGYIKRKEQVSLSSLCLVRFTTKERLYEIIDAFRDEGLQVDNPHSYLLSCDSKTNREAVRQAITKWNPSGLLNPGKVVQDGS